MESWVVITLYVCFYGCFKEIRPAAHFLTQYLEGPTVNLTHSQVNNEVYPVWTYSYLAFLPVIFLFTVFVKYKPFIILESAALVVTWLLLTWGRGLLTMQFMQAAFGVATATDVAYYTYIYAQVPACEYRKVTSFTRAAVWAGKLLSAILAQVLVSTRAMDYSSLNYLSLACVLVAFVLALFLPRTRASSAQQLEEKPKKQLHGEDGVGKEARDEVEMPLKGHETEDAGKDRRHSNLTMVRQMWEDVKRCYGNKILLQWSFWWILATSGNYQVACYIQPLWEDIYPAHEHENLYHGAVDAVKMALGIVVTIAMGFVKVDWNNFGEFILGFASAFEAAMLYVMADTTNIWIAYTCTCIFKVVHQMLITIASFQVAKDLTQSTRPLLFGCNTFFALIVHTLLTIVIVDKRGLSLEPRAQFVIYASYFFILGFFFLFMLALKKWRACRKKLSSTKALHVPLGAVSAPLETATDHPSC